MFENFKRKAAEMFSNPETQTPKQLAERLSRANEEFKKQLELYPAQKNMPVTSFPSYAKTGFEHVIGDSLNTAIWDIKKAIEEYANNKNSRQLERSTPIILNYQQKIRETSAENLPQVIEELINSLRELPE